MKKKKDSLGDRIKGYENVTRHYGVRRIPLMVRVDGKAFHTYTKRAEKPFDYDLISGMVNAATYVAENMQGFKVAYVQSDEASFVMTDYDSIETSAWFDYNISKIVSITAANMTGKFNKYMPDEFGGGVMPVFDGRAFNVSKEDVVNAFLWRAKDWERNSLQMYAQSYFSHGQLQGKKKPDIHDMLHGIGKNWTNDLTDQQKNGTFIVNRDGKLNFHYDVMPTYDSINDLIGDLICI